VYLTGVHLTGVKVEIESVRFNAMGAASMSTMWVVDDRVKSDEVSIVEWSVIRRLF
jgi:hypothetical protein